MIKPQFNLLSSLLIVAVACLLLPYFDWMWSGSKTTFEKQIDFEIHSYYVSDLETFDATLQPDNVLIVVGKQHGLGYVEVRGTKRSNVVVVNVDEDLGVVARVIDTSSRIWIDVGQGKTNGTRLID